MGSAPALNVAVTPTASARSRLAQGGARPRARRLVSGPALVAYLASVEFLLHLPNPGGYGFFIDELYFMACGQHLSWGYVDMPPLTAVQAWMARVLLGDSLTALRLLPTLASAAVVLLTGTIVRQLGGGRFAQVLAATAVLFAPFYLSFGSYLSMNSVEPLLWMGCAAVLIRIIRTGDERSWLWFGVLAGIGLENKHTMLLFGLALIAGLLMTPERRLMASRWFVLGGVAALLIFLPNLIWVVAHRFPHLEMLANIRRSQRNVALSPPGFIGMQILGMHPVAAPLWIGGLGVLLFAERYRPYRALGYAYLVTLAILLLSGGRFYYLAPAYPMLIASGAAAAETWSSREGRDWMRPAYLALLAATGVMVAFTALPLLPPETYVRYTHLTGISEPKFENRKASELPQFLADRFGWPEMAAAVAKVYNSLPAEQRARTAIFGSNYGEAGAIDFYGPSLGLPRAISGHNNYWYWGPRNYHGESVIVLGSTRAELERYFARVEPKAAVGHRYAMASEHFTIYLCTEPKGNLTLHQMWPKLKNWD